MSNTGNLSMYLQLNTFKQILTKKRSQKGVFFVWFGLVWFCLVLFCFKGMLVVINYILKYLWFNRVMFP